MYRPDTYAAAANSLIAEGKDFPNFTKETGFRAPQTEFIDGIAFDGRKPNEYLGKMAIGLKGKDVL